MTHIFNPALQDLNDIVAESQVIGQLKEGICRSMLEMSSRVAEARREVTELEEVLKQKKKAITAIVGDQWERVASVIRGKITGDRERLGASAQHLAFQFSPKLWDLTTRMLEKTTEFDCDNNIYVDRRNTVYELSREQYGETVKGGHESFERNGHRLGPQILFKYYSKRKGSLQVYFSVVRHDPLVPRLLQDIGMPN